MSKTKKLLIVLMLLIAVLLLPNIVNASDPLTATSTINGVTVNWTYELDENNQIKNLKCTNVADLTGSISIPSTIEDKTVVTIGNGAFENAVITEVTVPSSVKIIEYGAFKNCTSLSKVDLGSVEGVSFDVFEGCTALKEITIPKTLKDGAVSPVFTNCTNLTKITFEEGLTIIPANLCATTGITEITVPSSVKTIENGAFADCTSLNKVDLGNIEGIAFDVFKGCTALKEIVIPKTLKRASVSPTFTNCTNLTKITFEEGLTIIPANLCATTGITEITVPSSVEEIGAGAFEDCAELIKITILDNVTAMGFFTLYPDTDTVFKNHNKDLTIYCYEESFADQYARNTNIKYEYLTKSEEEPEETIDITSYILFPTKIFNGKGKLDLYSGVNVDNYTMYYQFVEISDEVYNKIIELDEKYKNKEITYEEYLAKYDEIITKYDDTKWIKTEDGSFECDLTKFTGTKKFALWVKLVMEDKTVYESQIYKIDGSEAAKNESNEQEKDPTIADKNLPDTGRVLLFWSIGIVLVAVVVAHVRYKKLYM